MVEQNGSGVGASADDPISAHDATSSLNGYGAAPEPPFADRPEVLIGAAVLGGVLLAGVVRRLGR